LGNRIAYCVLRIGRFVCLIFLSRNESKIFLVYPAVALLGVRQCNCRTTLPLIQDINYRITKLSNYQNYQTNYSYKNKFRVLSAVVLLIGSQCNCSRTLESGGYFYTAPNYGNGVFDGTGVGVEDGNGVLVGLAVMVGLGVMVGVGEGPLVNVGTGVSVGVSVGGSFGVGVTSASAG
jgi:hypothetical protein